MIWVKLYWQGEALNFCIQTSCLSRCRFKSPRIIFSQHVKAECSTKVVNSQIKSTLETLKGLYKCEKYIHVSLKPLK